MAVSKKDKLEIISNIFNGIEEYWVDGKGIIRATNLEAVTITGYEESEVVGKSFTVLYPPREVADDPLRDYISEAIVSRNLKTSMVLVRKDGVRFIAKVNFEVVLREGVEHVKITVQDKTYKSIQKQKMKRLESHFNSLFHNQFIGVLNVQQVDLKIIVANVRACEILNEHDFIGKSFDRYLPDEEAVRWFCSQLDKENDEGFEMKLIQNGGKTRWVRINYSLFTTEGMTELLLFDITDDKKRIEDLERINNQLDQFIYHISHDLRAPITTLLGLIAISKKEVQSMITLQGYLDLMLQRTRHLDSILIDLMSIALNEKTSLDFDTIKLSEEIQSIADQYVGDTSGPVPIHIAITQDFPFISDVKRLRIILRNLISNAIKYQNPAETQPFVKIRARAGQGYTFIEVEDNGIGIHAQHDKKIFEMFFRGTDKSSGSGMGLYIVKMIVEKLGGEISFTSHPGNGTLFQLVIPNRADDVSGDSPAVRHNGQRERKKFTPTNLIS